MNEVDIKPLSINRAWKGRTTKTREMKQYMRDLGWLLPKIDVPDGLLSVYYEFGFSNFLSDWDNPVKPFQDALQSRYEFDDKMIMEARVVKRMVKKGNEYIRFSIELYQEGDN